MICGLGWALSRLNAPNPDPAASLAAQSATGEDTGHRNVPDEMEAADEAQPDAALSPDAPEEPLADAAADSQDVPGTMAAATDLQPDAETAAEAAEGIEGTDTAPDASADGSFLNVDAAAAADAAQPAGEAADALAEAPAEDPSADLYADAASDAEDTPEGEEDATDLYFQQASAGAKYSNPSKNRLLTTKRWPAKGSDSWDEIRMGASETYAQVKGITTFRGNNYRDSASYGVIPENPSRLRVVWHKKIGRLAGWSGVGWTGQASLVHWDSAVRRRMNIKKAKKAKDNLVEVLYATLDGHIYFLDLADGEATRKAIDIGAPIKGSLSVDPRGYPLLYCGQGIYEVDGKRVDCGMRVWSLIDQKLLYFLDGDDKKALRDWKAFDGSPLIDGATDTMITAGENGVLYVIKLNTRYKDGKLSVKPAVSRYVYKQTAKGKLGSENSVAIYNHYVYFATNIGVIQCVDLNTLKLVWSFDAKDDIDASLVIEPESDGTVALYAANELDGRGRNGKCQMIKLNALTGELIWYRNSAALYKATSDGSGCFATPAMGREDLSQLVYFHVARVKKGGGILYALDKRSGKTVWQRTMGRFGWSSPTCVYTASGKGYVLVGNADGMLRLLDGLTGESVAEVQLKGNIEGSPAVFGNMIVIGTRSSQIYGIRIA